jgi:hypothetical protein
MNRSRLNRLEQEISAVESRPVVPQTEEGKRQFLLSSLPKLCADAFRRKDRRADVKFLRTLSLGGPDGRLLRGDRGAENDRLWHQLNEVARAGKHQAAPFTKGQPTGQPKKPGRKP